MHNQEKYLRLSIVLSIIILTVGCQKQNYQQTAYNHYTSDNQLEEYVSRIGKRLVIVSENPMVNYKFKVMNTKNRELYIKNNSINISQALLKSLDDEAELAAVLVVAINKSKSDKNRLLNLSRAGYDPKALVDVKQKSINNQNIYGVFSADDLTAERLSENNTLIPKLPKGLQRQQQSYKQNVGI